MLGAGLALASFGPPSLRNLGETLSTYGALAFVVVGGLSIVGIIGSYRQSQPNWIAACAGAGLVLAFAAAAISRRIAPAFAGLAIALGTCDCRRLHR